MKIKATDNALRLLEINPEFMLPESAKECLTGGLLFNSTEITPDLTKDIEDIGNIIDGIKGELNEKIRNISPGMVSILPSELSFQDVLDVIQITLITRNDENVTHIPVRNLFKYVTPEINEYSYDVEVVSGPNGEEEGLENLLGVYKPKTGTIFLWIDKIIEQESPELICQMVLLHELIHALLDIHPRIFYKFKHGVRILTSLGKPNQRDMEETLDNTLVLRAYSNHSEVIEEVEEFISNQPSAYSESINVFKNKDYIELLRQHLSEKIGKGQINCQDDMFFDVTYLDEETKDEDDEKREFSPKFFKSYIEALREHLEMLYDIKMAFEESLSGLNSRRFLVDNEWFVQNYHSPWIVVIYDDSRKEILLQIGDKFYIRYDYNAIINVYRKDLGKDIKPICAYNDIDPTIESEALIQELVLNGLVGWHYL